MQEQNDLMLKGFKILLSTRLSMMLKKFLKMWKIRSEQKLLVVTSCLYPLFILYGLIVSNYFYIPLYIIPHSKTIINIVKNTNEEKECEFCFY